MKIAVNYKTGGNFEVEADTLAEIQSLLNTTLEVMWRTNQTYRVDGAEDE